MRRRLRNPGIEFGLAGSGPLIAFAFFDPGGGAGLDFAGVLAPTRLFLRIAHGAPLGSAASLLKKSVNAAMPLARCKATVRSARPMRWAISLRERPSIFRMTTASRQRSG